VTRRTKAPRPGASGDGNAAAGLSPEAQRDRLLGSGAASGSRTVQVDGQQSGIISTGDNSVNILNQVTVPPDALSQPRRDDPDHLGLVENPIQVLNLDATATNAKSLEASDPLESASLYGTLADRLQDANFPDHAVGQRVRQAQLLHAGGETAAGFGILWSLAVAEFKSGAVRRSGSLARGLDMLRPGLDDLRTAKLVVLNAAQDWYERGSLLPATVPALEMIAAAADPEAPFLACTVLEQVVTDGWFDFDPPYSLVTPDAPDGNMPGFLARLRQCADTLTSSDAVVRARLACAVADATLTAISTATQTEAVYAPILDKAGAGRYLHAGGLVYARAARGFAMHGDTARAIDLWRQSILQASGSRQYGDVLACRRALNAALLEQPVPLMAELDFTSSLPNANRLLAATQPPAAQALGALHAGRLPDAFTLTRRYLWESRLSGQLSDERASLELFGDILLAAGRPVVAIIAWMTGGTADKAAAIAASNTQPVDASPWARSPARACQATAAQVIGAQAQSYGAADAEDAVHLLLGLTGELWTTRRIAPDPSIDAVIALSRFGIDLPDSAVDPVLSILRPHLAAGGALTPETVDLVIQLYWAVPGRRKDLTAVIGPQLRLGDSPPGLWEMISNLPGQARDPLIAVVNALAEAGDRDALLTLAKWGQATEGVQFAARRTAAYLLRQPASQRSATWSNTTLYADTAEMLIALADNETLASVDPQDLRPDAGPVLAGRTPFPIRMSMADPSADIATAPVAGHADGNPPSSGSAHPDKEHSGTGPVDAAESGWEPDQAAIVAAGPPTDVATAVARHLLLYAENQHAPAFIRTGAVAALHSLLRVLLPNVNGDLAGHLLAIAEDPALNDLDQAELASQDPLSRGRLDTGAKNLPVFALLAAATAAGLAAKTEPGIDSLSDQAVQRLFAQAIQLLHSPDPEAARYGAGALAWVSRYAPRLAPFTSALITHPTDKVRDVAAAMASLDEAAQRVLASDPSPQVRSTLASRASELADDVLSTLQADEHAQVRRVFTVLMETGETADA
jgi:hypothetical protein